MAGIYVHIPFCKQACTYCNFHFSTRLAGKGAILDALRSELRLRQHYLSVNEYGSLYLGGGTPSLLTGPELRKLLDDIQELLPLRADAEITLEANPDDLSRAYLKELASTSVNRLSIGLQSFRQEDLSLMNRAHTAQQSAQCLEDARSAGFTNITVDLIYALPGQSAAQWEAQLAELARWEVPHFSAYALTLEPRTVLHHQVEKGQLSLPGDEVAAQHFALLQSFAESAHYRHYELSNLAQDGAEARHNTSYWQASPYLGLGPAAHSYDGHSRQWNVSNNARYMRAIQQGEVPAEREELRLEDRYNEYVMTQLRLQKGLSWADLRKSFGESLYQHARREAVSALKRGQLVEEQERCYIPAEWRFHSDGIAAHLFYL